MLPALEDIPKKKLLEKAAKVDKFLGRFKSRSITKINYFMQKQLLLQIG